MEYVNAEQFADAVYAPENMVVIVCFGAEWCPPCKMFKPVLERISDEYDEVCVYGVDIDQDETLSKQFNISGVPTTIFFRNGKEIKKLVGFRDYDSLKATLSDVQNDLFPVERN